MTDDAGDWTDPARPPTDAIDLGGGVWASWAEGWAETHHGRRLPLIWHWCDRSVTKERDDDGTRQAWWFEPRWIGAGVRDHTLVSSDPLHLEPSLLWPDCCGKHGFIRDGRWAPA